MSNTPPKHSYAMQVLQLRNRVKDLEEIVDVQAKRIESLSGGINLPGWWCNAITPKGMPCDIFNGESVSKHPVCRCCGAAKLPIPVQPQRVAIMSLCRCNDTEVEMFTTTDGIAYRRCAHCKLRIT